MTQTNAAPRLTVVGLFEDVIDANHALADLKGGLAPPEGVSLIVREHITDETDGKNQASAVATALSEAALDQAGEWLMHLVSLTVANDGAFLVAGPIGAILADSESVSRWNESAVPHQSSVCNDVTRSLLTALMHFGYGEDEADYLAQRVIAGSVLIGLTTADSHQASEARRTFADQNAVHIGTNWTDSETAARAETLVNGAVVSGSDDKVVVFDSVSLLVSLCGHENPDMAATCGGAAVFDRNGEEAGVIEDLLAEIRPAGQSENDNVVVRYVVIGFGGLLGVGRSFVAVPAVHVTLDADPVALDMDRQTFHSAPLYHANKPFSRHEEELICSYFGSPRYWL